MTLEQTFPFVCHLMSRRNNRDGKENSSVRCLGGYDENILVDCVFEVLTCTPQNWTERIRAGSCICPFGRTVMKSGSEMVKAGLRTFFENAAEDLEKTLENLKLGKFTHSRSQMKGVSQNINYTTVALLPILTALFEHITEHQFGSDLLRELNSLIDIESLMLLCISCVVNRSRC